MYYKDGSDHTYFGDHPKLVAVGWMNAPWPIPQGSVASEDLDLLIKFALGGVIADEEQGIHDCTFCPRGYKDPQTDLEVIAGQSMLLGVDNRFVPHEGKLYHFPDSIVHYIVVHGYKPPEEFLDAIRYWRDPQKPEYRAECDRLFDEIIADWRRWDVDDPAANLGDGDEFVERAPAEGDAGAPEESDKVIVTRPSKEP